MRNHPTYAREEGALNFTPYFDYFTDSSLYGPSSMHPGGAFHLFGDGSVRFVEDDVEANVYVAMATRAGEEAANRENLAHRTFADAVAVARLWWIAAGCRTTRRIGVSN